MALSSPSRQLVLVVVGESMAELPVEERTSSAGMQDIVGEIN